MEATLGGFAAHSNRGPTHRPGTLSERQDGSDRCWKRACTAPAPCWLSAARVTSAAVDAPLLLESRAGGMLALDSLNSTPLERKPFDHLVVPRFLRTSALAEVTRDFPAIRGGGSYPVECLRFGPSFDALLDELESREVCDGFSEKFAIDLTERPILVTVRGHTRARDGRIHTDSKSKLITALIYCNVEWNEAGGRLRLLRSPTDIDDFFIEVPPAGGVLIAFRCCDHAWHGHLPFVGPRQTIQVNWVLSESIKSREIRRHGRSARLKSLFSRG